jgi:hypothetical protein
VVPFPGVELRGFQVTGADDTSENRRQPACENLAGHSHFAEQRGTAISLAALAWVSSTKAVAEAAERLFALPRTASRPWLAAATHAQRRSNLLPAPSTVECAASRGRLAVRHRRVASIFGAVSKRPSNWTHLAGELPLLHEMEGRAACLHKSVCYFAIPKGLDPSAQGCEARATLGWIAELCSTLKGL